MFRLFARHPASRLLLVLPLLAMASCGNDSGAVITVPNSVVVADLMGNGVQDVVVAAGQIDETGLTQQPGLMGTIMNSPSSPGSFSGITNYVSSSAPPSGLAVGDLTGTGTHDIVVANLNDDTLAIFLETSATSGIYNQAKTISLPAGSNPNDVQIADLNGDGLPDLVVANNVGNVMVLLATSPGAYTVATTIPITNPLITAEGLPTRAVSVAVGDLNGDGLPDLAVTSFDEYGDYGLISIYFQNPTTPGTFTAQPTIQALGEPSQIKIADVNQDGANDLVVALQGLGANYATVAAEANEGAMVLLQNTGSAAGTFAAPVIYPAYSGVISLAIGDLNNDGLPDIAMCSLYPEGQGYIVTLLQVAGAPGTFGAPTDYVGLGQPVSIVIADINNDGLNDLVTADATSAVWLENQATTPGTFISQGQIGL
jgi:FG-GAP-like repeat